MNRDQPSAPPVLHPRRLGVTGSRHYTNRRNVETVLYALAEGDTLIISGGAQGADRYAASFAETTGLELKEFLIDDEPKSMSFDQRAHSRNRKIVDASDVLLAFRAPGKSNGTDGTVAYAKQQGKPYIIFDDTGKIVEHGNGFQVLEWLYE